MADRPNGMRVTLP
jgi:hypothetical protein